MEVSGPELGRILGITARQVTSLKDQGVIVRLAHGKYAVEPSVQGYVRHKVETEVSRVRRNAGSADDELKRLRIERERLKLAFEVRDIVKVDDALFFLDQFCGLVNVAINNVPARFTRDLDTRDRLQEHIDEALTKVAAGVAECGAALRADRGLDPPGPDDGDD